MPPTTEPAKTTIMIDLHRFLTNPFDEPGISLDELLAFSTDHLQRLLANNSGSVFAARITATTAALGVLGTAFTDDQTKLGLRKARKLAKNHFRAALPESIAKIYGVVTGKFGPSAPEVAECFPAGRSVFTKAVDDKLANELQTLVNGVTAHQAQLGTQVVTDATTLVTGWNAVYAPSETSSGAKATTQAAKSAARAGLQLELFKNLLTIALNYPRLPELLDVYMQQSLLADHPASPATPAPKSPVA